MPPRVRTGINTVTRRAKDGSVTHHFYDRKNRRYLGTDRDVAINHVMGAGSEMELQFAAKLRDPIIKTGLLDTRLAVGDAGEMFVMSELAMGGLIVLRPSTNTPYDFAVDDGNGFWRIQVKTKKSEVGGPKPKVTFQLMRRSNGAVLPSYHDRGVDIMAFVYWPWRAIGLRRASEMVGTGMASFPLSCFDRLPPLLDRWSRMSEAMRGTSGNSPYASDSQQPRDPE